ncbi:MAG: STT3 domain-containing protein [Candidatus Anstonellaceae archaeon]
MILFNKFYVLLYALIFGLAGLPWAFYILKKRDFNFFEKIVFGYFIGLTFTPFLFILELFFCLKFSLSLVYLNMAIVFFSGLILLLQSLKNKEIELKFNFQPKINQDIIGLVGLFIIMLIIFIIGYSNSGIPIMDLDPYFYLDGVRQVVYEGYNYFDDKTAWYPEPISSHVGNPIWKYTLASWFVLYNQDQQYDPYNLVVVGSILQPLLGALSVFFGYLLFRELYNKKIALLVAALIAFSPIMLIKFQGGDFQIEPYNIFALLAAFYALTFYLKLKEIDKESILLFSFCFIPIYLGSNLYNFFSLILTVYFVLYILMNFIFPKKDFEFSNLIKLLIIIGILAFIYFLYLIFSKMTILNALSNIKIIIMPVIFIPIFYYLLNKFKIPGVNSKFGILAIISIAMVVFAIFLLQIQQIRELALATIGVAGYTSPLVRTIAEQAPGPSSFSDSLGFFGQDLVVMEKQRSIIGEEYNTYKLNLIQSNSIIIKMYNYIITYFAVIGFPTIFIDIIYNLFTNFGNVIFGENTYIYIPKNISFLTIAAFFSLTLVLIKTVYQIKNKKEWDLDLIMAILLFIIIIVSFGKQKFVMYSAFCGIFFVGMFFGLSQKAFWYLANKYKKETLKKYVLVLHLIVGIIALLLNPELFATAIFLIALSSIGILIFFDYLFEQRSLIGWIVISGFILFQFFGPFLFSMQILNMNNNEVVLEDFQKLAGEYGLNAYALFINSFTPRIYDDLDKVLPLLDQECKKNQEQSYICFAIEQIKQRNYSDLNPAYFYNSEMCRRSLLVQKKDQKISPEEQYAYSYRCSIINPYWLDVMYWISKNTEKDARIISWWDYGHWINFFGQRNTVLRNEHASHNMIGRTAAAFLHKDIEFLKQTMREYGSKYMLVDIEIIGSGTDKNNVMLGGKYHALNYLGCAWLNQTNVTFYPGQSSCEQEHLWEQAYIPSNSQKCIISKEKNISGILGYKTIYKDKKAQLTPAYCFTQEYTADGIALRSYLLDQKNTAGDLKIHRAEWKGYQTDQGIYLIAFYTKYPAWQDENGTMVDGWEDRTTKYYDSNLYSAFFFDELDGFELVYNTPYIRLFKLKE